MIERDPRLDAIAAGNISSTALLASLIATLEAKGTLSEMDVRAVYQDALMLLQRAPVDDDPVMHAIYQQAQEVIEEQLKP